MKSRYIIYGLSVLAAMIISIIFSLFKPMKIFEISMMPNVLFVFALCVGFTKGTVVGGVLGAICGFIYDISSPLPIGVFTLIFLLFGLLMGYISTKLNNENVFLLIVFIALSTVLFEVLTFNIRYIAYFIQYGFSEYWTFFTRKLNTVIIGTAVSNVLLALLFRWLMFDLFLSIGKSRRQIRFRGNI